MSARVVSEMDADGRLVARKRSRDEDDAVRLAHEADVLAAAQHPGVVELVGGEQDGTGLTLVTTFVGPHSLDTLGAVSVDRAAGLIAALAETVADLHDLGLVHGRIDPSHVVIGAGGRPVLCGFAGGGRIGTTPPPGPTAAPEFCDPAATDGAALTPQVDVFGLGCLLRTLLGDVGSEVEPIPDRRFLLGRARGSWFGYQRRALLTLADRATDESPLRRPPARRLAADIHDTMPSAHLADDNDAFATLRASADELEPAHKTRWATVAVVAVGLLLLLTGLTSRTSAGSGAAHDDEFSSTAHAPAPSRAPSTTAVHVEEGGIVVIGTQRFSVGLPGDRVAVGDWNCDGTATLAVLRPATGALFMFDSWASEGADISVESTRTVIGGVDIAARSSDDACSTLVVIHDDGTQEEIT